MEVFHFSCSSHVCNFIFRWQESNNIAHVLIVLLSSPDGCVSLKLLRLISIPEVIYKPFCSSCQSEELIITVSTFRRSHSAVNVLFSRQRGWNSKGNKQGVQLNWWMFWQLHPLPSWTQRTFAMTSPFTQFSSEIRLCGWQPGVCVTTAGSNIPQIRDWKKVAHIRNHNIIPKKDFLNVKEVAFLYNPNLVMIVWLLWPLLYNKHSHLPKCPIKRVD